MRDDPYAHERAAAHTGKRIQANRGSHAEPHWVTLDGMPEFTCDADLYRVHPDDDHEEPAA